MQDIPAASLFGLKWSNRDFSKEEAWGKNQFNSSFPAALCCYLEFLGLPANYCHVENGIFVVGEISIPDLFGISCLSEDVFYNFECSHTPYQGYVEGELPRTDLVLTGRETGRYIRAFEVKLTALPDNTTCLLDDALYGCELVVRPDTIVYLACSLIEALEEDELIRILGEYPVDLESWQDPADVLRHIATITGCVNQLAMSVEESEIPFLLQPIWKTKGKSPELADFCLDVFAWSNSAFCKFIAGNARSDSGDGKITRHTRTAIWLYKMLLDYAENGHFDYRRIIDSLSYHTKNDKAFASSGIVTNRYMRSPNLTQPRVSKHQIKDIILGRGQDLLSPERRFDAIVFNTAGLFD